MTIAQYVLCLCFSLKIYIYFTHEAIKKNKSSLYLKTKTTQNTPYENTEQAAQRQQSEHIPLIKSYFSTCVKTKCQVQRGGRTPGAKPH